MALEKELATFNSKLQEIKEEQGKYALIHGDELVGIFVAYEDALKQGYDQFGLEPFLVKKIEATETVQLITRLIDPQCRISL